MFLTTLEGVLNPSAIICIDDEEFPCDDPTVAYRKVHYHYTNAETRTVWAAPADVEAFLEAAPPEQYE